MGAWGSEPLANDDAWDFVNQLAATSTSDRHGLILTALTLAATAESWLDVDDANGAVMAAFLVATARSPSNYPEQRQQLIETVSSVYDIHSLADLVGSMRTIRSAKVATLALRAIDRVAGDSELSTLWADDADFAASLEALRAALRSPVRRWKTTDEPMPTGEPLRRRWAAGTLLSIDLGDGHRTYAQLLETSFIACYDARQPVTDPVFRPADIVTRPILFTVTVNELMDRPPGWHTVGTVSVGAEVLPTPDQFRQQRASRGNSASLEHASLVAIPLGHPPYMQRVADGVIQTSITVHTPYAARFARSFKLHPSDVANLRRPKSSSASKQC